MNKEMIPGNVDKTVMHPKENLHCYKLLTEKRSIDPRAPTFPIIRQRITVFRPADYRVYFEGTADSNIHYLHCMGFASASLVWDPCLPGARELDEEVKANEAAEREASGVNAALKAKEGKRKATIKDIESLIGK